MAKKMWAYLVVGGTYKDMKVGTMLLYPKSYGPSHAELIRDIVKGTTCGFSMVRVGPCWEVDGKMQFEEPPLKSGELTRRIMDQPKKKPAKAKPKV